MDEWNGMGSDTKGKGKKKLYKLMERKYKPDRHSWEQKIEK